MDDPSCGVIVILALMAVNALIEALLTSMESVSEANAQKRAEDGERAAGRVVYLLAHHRRYITVTDLSRILLLSGMAVTYDRLILPALKDAFCALCPDMPVVRGLLLVLITALAVLLVELFSVKLPKKTAYKHAERAAYRGAWLLRFLMRLFAPAAWLLETATRGLLALFHVKASESSGKVTEEELIYSVQEAQEKGILEADEAEMIHNIFAFDEKEVKDIMTHRRNMTAVDVSMTVEEALGFMTGAPYSRFPVYEESIENIVGILHLKDVAAACVEGSEELRRRTVREIAKEPYFIPDTQGLDVLFKDMQTKKIHMAIAIDEYGQTAGLITMEDILEEIVGDIQDEYDKEEEEIVENPDGTWTVAGTVGLEDLEEQTGMKVDGEDFDTLNGFLISKLDHIPADGERATILCGSYQVDILETKNRMIRQARVTLLAEAETEEE